MSQITEKAVKSALAAQGIVDPAQIQAEADKLAATVAPNTIAEMGLADVWDKANFALQAQGGAPAAPTATQGNLPATGVSEEVLKSYEEAVIADQTARKATAQNTIINTILVSSPGNIVLGVNEGTVNAKSFTSLKEKLDNKTYVLINKTKKDANGNEVTINSQAVWDEIVAAQAAGKPLAVHKTEQGTASRGYIVSVPNKGEQIMTKDDMKNYLTTKVVGQILRSDDPASVGCKLRFIEPKTKANGDTTAAKTVVVDVKPKKEESKVNYESIRVKSNETGTVNFNSELVLYVNVYENDEANPGQLKIKTRTIGKGDAQRTVPVERAVRVRLEAQSNIFVIADKYVDKFQASNAPAGTEFAEGKQLNNILKAIALQASSLSGASVADKQALDPETRAALEQMEKAASAARA